MDLAAELHAQNEPGRLAETVVMDVRNDEEWSHGHIAGAVHVALGHILEGFSASPDFPIVVQCQSGARSAIAASVLMRAGYTNVRNMTGGFNAWLENNEPEPPA